MRAAKRTISTVAASISATASAISHGATSPAAIRAGIAIGITGGTNETIRAAVAPGCGLTTKSETK
jgi:hypothetical protein